MVSAPNADVDATGPGTSLGTDADGAPRTCGDLPALPGCIPRLVRSLDDAADRHRVERHGETRHVEAEAAGAGLVGYPTIESAVEACQEATKSAWTPPQR